MPESRAADAHLDEAVRVLRAGGLVAIPTETVYGLAADASNPDAVARIFSVKGRPAGHPLIVHVAAATELDRWASDVSPAARRLAETCWPGPLTLVVPRAPAVLDAVTGGRSSVGLRVPAHPLALELLGRFGGGLAAPSANRFGRVSPTSAAHVRADLGDAVDLVLDGGQCPVGVESTIVDCTVEPPQVLRPGAVTHEQVTALLADLLAGPVEEAVGPSRAPGMLDSHYAPSAAVVLADTSHEAVARTHELRAAGRTVELVDPGDDLAAYARDLYAWLRAADARHTEVVVAVLPTAVGLGHAIRDRLIKAAAPRAR